MLLEGMTEKVISFFVVGCVIVNEYEHKATPLRWLHSFEKVEYFKSPHKGKPAWENCTRI
jgi:hypothetical protein